MKPSDEQLNLLMAQTLGYKSAGRTGMFAILVLRPGTDQPVAPPDFCNDRNALPEIWAIIEQKRVIDTFVRFVTCTGNPYYKDKPMPDCNPSFVVDWLLITAPLRVQVIAALKALREWPHAWQEGDTS